MECKLYAISSKKIGITHSSVLRLREKQEEHRSCHPLHGIDLKDWSFKKFFNFSKFTVA